MMERLLRAVLAALVGATVLIGLAQPAVATECGCTEVGPYEAPAVRALTTGATSPSGGTYRLTTSQNASFVTLEVRQSTGNALVQSFTVPLSRVQYGWSPDGKRFMVRHGQPSSVTHDSVVLWDLVGDRQIVSTSMTSGAATGFSPHGRWFYVNQLLGPGWANLSVWNASTPGTVALSRETTFANVPGSGADSFGSIGFGFSSDDADRSLVQAYRAINGTTQVTVRNLQTRADVYSTSLTNASGAFWRFSPCGDAFAIVSNQLANTADVTIRKTAVSGSFGSRTFSPLPAVIAVESTLEKHRIRTVSSSGATSYTNVADNTADTSCPVPPSLTSLGLSPTSVTGGTTNSTATLTLTSAATGAMTASLSSSDTSAATVPSTVSFSSGQTSRTFTVTSKSVTTAKTTTITATVAGVTRTAVLTVNPASTTPPVTRRVTALAVAPSSVTSGQTALATVTLDGAAPAGGTTVSLSAPSGSPVTAPATVTVPGGQSTGSATLTTGAVTASTPVSLTATAGGGTASATLTVLPASTSTSPQAVVVDEACKGATIQPNPRNDDQSSDQVRLPFPIRFFGFTADHLYVNNNGNVTFGAPLSTYVPFQITASTPPIIAPFLADVDTRGLGNDSKPVSFSVQGAPATFEGRPAFCVNWVDVGYYNSQTNPTNSFQLLLVDRGLPAGAPAGSGHDFDIVMNYDRILWQAGSASNGIAAGAGYSSGSGAGLMAGGGFPSGGTKTDSDAPVREEPVRASTATSSALTASAASPASYFEFPGSRVTGAFLDSNAGTGLTQTSRGTLQRGRHIFEVRSGGVPTGRTLRGVVTGPSGPVVGAPVQVCSGTTCQAFTSTGATGAFQAPGLPAGDYDVRVQAPAGSTLTGKTVRVTVGTDADAVQDIALTGPEPLPGDATVEPSTTNGQGIPNVYWGDALQVTTTGCAGGTATWTVSRAGSTPLTGTMTESTTTAGQYAGTIPPLRDFGAGLAQVTFAIDCPGDLPDESDTFDLYIDPSGNVLTLGKNPVPDALVTLLRSDTEAGPFTVVPNGSVVMSPKNRTNPDRTDAAGHFGWDTLAGFYVVQAEREGCTAPGGAADFVRTDVLPVPPEWKELKLVLDCPSIDAQVPQDTEAPTATHAVSPDANANGWHRGPVTVTLSAADAGTPSSGIAGITYALSGASTGGTTANAATVEVPVTQQGDTTITYFATDGAGNVSATREVVVSLDSTAPVIRCSTTPSKLGPPNHKMHDVRVAVGVTDAGSGPAGFTLTSATSSEPDNGLGDGDTRGDIAGWTVGAADTTGQLRAERSGKGNGRTYSLTYVATDAAGNTSAPCVAKVVVAK